MPGTFLGAAAIPPGVDPDVIIAKVGDIWKSWGWYVIEREGFYKPNRFGYAPDGYSLQIMASQPGYPPSLEAVYARAFLGICPMAAVLSRWS
jgi:hypothetical protein